MRARICLIAVANSRARARQTNGRTDRERERDRQSQLDTETKPVLTLGCHRNIWVQDGLLYVASVVNAAGPADPCEDHAEMATLHTSDGHALRQSRRERVEGLGFGLGLLLVA